MSYNDPVSEAQQKLLDDLTRELKVEAKQVSSMGEARREINRLMALKNASLSESQIGYLEKLEHLYGDGSGLTANGRLIQKPASYEDYQERVRALAPTPQAQSRAREQFITPRQIEYLTSLERTFGEGAGLDENGHLLDVPQTRTELDLRISALTRVTDAQRRRLAQLAAATGQKVPAPADRFEARDLIDQLEPEAQIARAEDRALAEEFQQTGGTATGVRPDEFARPAVLGPSREDEIWERMSPQQRAAWEERSAAAGVSVFNGGAPEMALPGAEPSVAQIDLIRRLCEERGIEFEAPIDTAEAQQMIEGLRGPAKPPSDEQLNLLDRLAATLKRSRPEVATSVEASQQIDRLQRIQLQKTPDAPANPKQLEYLEQLCERNGIAHTAPTTALKALRMVDALRQLQREDPDQKKITRDLLVSPQDEFEEAMRSLRPQEADVLRCRYRENLSVAETGAKLAVSHRDVETREVIGRDKFARTRAIGRPSRSAAPKLTQSVQSSPPSHPA